MGMFDFLTGNQQNKLSNAPVSNTNINNQATDLNWAQMATGQNMADGSQILNQYNNVLDNQGNPLGAYQGGNLMQQQQGMSGTDMLGFGLGAVNMGLDYSNQKQQLGIAKDNLALNQDKFSFLKQNRADTQANSQAMYAPKG